MTAAVLRRFRRRLLFLAPVALLLALAPSVLYLDHWSEYFGLVPQHEESPVEHIGHCHVAPGSCSDQPLVSNPGAQATVADIVVPELTAVAIVVVANAPAAHLDAPPTEPPRP